MFDTNAFNRLLDSGQDPAAVAYGRDLFATHIQLRELSATKNLARAQALATVFHETPQEVIPTAAAIWDVSEYCGAEYGDADGAYPDLLQRLNAANGGKDNNCHDALIGVTALKRKLTLVTNDRDLARAIREMGGTPVTFEDFVAHAD